MHVLRDCDVVLELWEKIVNPEVWYKFASLRLHKWLEYYLQSHEVGMGICIGPLFLVCWCICSG